MARSEMVALNEHMLTTEGRAIYLKNDLVDHDRYGVAEWVRKHKRYAPRHVRFLQEIKAPAGMELPPSRSGTQAQRRRWTEANLYGRSPLFLRAFVYFLYRYILRLGFLDGPRGLVFHFLHGLWYRLYVDAEIVKQRLTRAGRR